MDAKKIGEFLKALRKSKGMTQADVADELYLSAKTISRWESGVGIPDINIITSVADLYGVTVDEILNGKKIRENENVQTNPEKIIKNEKNSIKLLSNNLVKKYDVFFYISLGVLPLFLIIERIVKAFEQDLILAMFVFCIGLIFSLVILIIGNFQIKEKIKDASDEKNITEIKIIVKEKIRKKNYLYADIIFIYIFLLALLDAISFVIEYYVLKNTLSSSSFNSIEYGSLIVAGIIFGIDIVFALLYLFLRNIKKICRKNVNKK